MVHLLRGDVVINDCLAVLQRCCVRVATDEVRRVQVWIGGVGGQVPGQVIGSCQEKGDKVRLAHTVAGECHPTCLNAPQPLHPDGISENTPRTELRA